ncbi:MAG: ABC transporter permease [Thermomicrobiales bacterium]
MSAFTLRPTLPLASSLVAIALALLTGGLFLEARGNDALAAYRILFDAGFGDVDGVTETLKKSAPLLIVGAGLLIALKAGVWNIGIDGQVLIGALCAGVVGPELAGNLPNMLMLPLVALAGFAGGLAWAVVPGVLRVRWGLNEIITTLMMNYVALNVTAWLVRGPAKDPNVVPPQTRLIPREHRLPDVPGTEVHVGLVLGLLVVLAVFVLFRATVPGFMLSILGRNRRAAAHAGMPVGRLTLAALLLSGGCAGLAGAIDVLSVKGLFQGNWNPGYGFTAFALVYLARLSSLWLIPFAVAFAALIVGGDVMPRRAGIPTYYVEMLEGLMLLFFAVAVYLERTWASRRLSSVGPKGRMRGVSCFARREGAGPSPTTTRPSKSRGDP